MPFLPPCFATGSRLPCQIPPATPTPTGTQHDDDHDHDPSSLVCLHRPSHRRSPTWKQQWKWKRRARGSCTVVDRAPLQNFCSSWSRHLPTSILGCDPRPGPLHPPLSCSLICAIDSSVILLLLRLLRSNLNLDLTSPYHLRPTHILHTRPALPCPNPSRLLSLHHTPRIADRTRALRSTVA